MSTRLILALLVASSGCGDRPTAATAGPDPIPWTPSLELAAISLDDPLVLEAVASLSDRGTADAVGALVRESRALAEANRVGAAAERVSAALEALRRDDGSADDVHVGILQLVLGDVQERFVQALSPAPTH